MKKTIAGIALLALIASATFGCGGDPKPDPKDPNSRQNVLKGNSDPAGPSSDGTTAPGRGLVPGEGTTPPPPPAGK